MNETVRALFRLETELGASWKNLHHAETSTHARIAKLDSAVRPLIPQDTTFVIFGSVARLENTSGSDLDWTLLVDGISNPSHFDAALEIKEVLEDLDEIEPGPEGTFGSLALGHDLLHYIGGEDDTNRNMTRRILLLLESRPLGDDRVHNAIIRNVLRRYLSEDFGWVYGHNPIKPAVPRFLHNDIVRYWRTVAVDFAYKIRSRRGHGWALRSTKLRLSRKLTYAAGILFCFNCATDPSIASLEVDNTERLHRVTDYLWQLTRSTPLDIVASAFIGRKNLAAAAKSMFDAYDEFIGMLEQPDLRDQLKRLAPKDSNSDPLFTRSRRLGHHFQAGLDALFLQDSGTELFELTKKYGVF